MVVASTTAEVFDVIPYWDKRQTNPHHSYFFPAASSSSLRSPPPRALQEEEGNKPAGTVYYAPQCCCCRQARRAGADSTAAAAAFIQKRADHSIVMLQAFIILRQILWTRKNQKHGKRGFIFNWHLFKSKCFVRSENSLIWMKLRLVHQVASIFIGRYLFLFNSYRLRFA